MNLIKTAVLTVSISFLATPSAQSIRLVPECLAKLFRKQVPAPTYIGLLRIASINAESAETLINKIINFSEDSNIHGILLLINSGGGVGSAGELVFREMEKLSSKKPVVALATRCCSAAYYITTAANWIVAPQAAIIGGIGVRYTIERHTNCRVQHANGYCADIQYEIIHAGKFKALYDENAPALTDEERNVIQSELDDDYQIFFESVAQRRNLSLDNLEEWADGKTFNGRKALELGLVDQIGGYSDAMDQLFTIMSEKGIPVAQRYQFIE